MTEVEIIETIDKMNHYLEHQLWMDFEIIEYSSNRLRIIGNIDISDNPTIEILFNDVFFVSAPFSWQTDTSKKVVSLLSGVEAKKINTKFHVEQGYYIIKIRPEDYPDDFGCIFGIKDIYFKLL